MRKWIYWALCLTLLLGMWLQPGNVHALTALEPEHPCSLQLDYSQDGQGFAQLPVQIYRVAEAFPDGTFQLLAPFSQYPVNIHGVSSQKEWQDIAATLRAYILADQLEPTCTELTDPDGMVLFEGLQTGLYLVCGTVAENQNGVYRFNDFMVYLPTPTAQEGYQYDVQAKPKCSHFTPYTQYTVRKLWKDFEREDARPESVQVDIYKDGILQETIILHAENNWTGQWRAAADEGIWTVVERPVPENYEVVITQVDNAFVITNISTLPVNPPDTGDVFPLSLVTVAMCVSGVVLLLLGVLRERKRT